LRRDINVTPMIDVMLVLLVVFMVAMQFVIYLEVQVPPPATDDIGNPRPQVVVELRADGSYALNGSLLSLRSLAPRLRTLYGTGERHVLYVRAAPTRLYREVIEVVDIARGAGVPVIGYMP
jgi:biopolymer transport protein ExbD